MSFHDELVAQTARERNGLLSVPIIQSALAGRIAREDYVAFLNQAFHHVRHTVPLLMACGARLPARLEWLRTAVGEYIEEEMGHHEWVLDDIAACGEDRAAAEASSPSLATELMVSYAYDTIQRGNPVGFFGMVLVLEGTSIALAEQAASKIAGTLQLPRKAFTYLNSHGALDQDHIKFFESLMNKITEPAEQALIIHSAKRFFHLYGDVFRSLEQPHGLTKKVTTEEVLA